jgi:hypothetical protein
MKPLYFTACSHPRVAPALSAQTHESLRPYTGYLKSALNAAIKREERSFCNWELVPQEYQIQISPIDTLIAIEREGYNYLVEDWQGDAPIMPLFVGAQYRPVAPISKTRSPNGIELVLSEEIDPADTVFWEGRACRLVAQTPSWLTSLVVTKSDGNLAHICQRQETKNRLLLIIEGFGPVELQDQEGRSLSSHILEPHEDATYLMLGNRQIPWTGQRSLSLNELPSNKILTASNGMRWEWSSAVLGPNGRRNQGVWIQLLQPQDIDSEATVDIRAAYCEEGVREVRTQRGRNPDHSFKVRSVRRDNYQLELDRPPQEGSTLFIPSSTSGLRRQRQVIFRLKDSPLPHHRGLLTLCEAPDKVLWSGCRAKEISNWYLLKDETFSGTRQQRTFVQKALGTSDFAFLEGPPGSGKTHAICELILQFLDEGRTVLLCSTTHVAVDNVLERLVGRYEQVEAVRIGLADRVDHAVRAVQIDERISALVESWRVAEQFSHLNDDELERIAEATILSSVNLTCGTSTGILAHPYIRRVDEQRDDDSGPRAAYFDVLIIDEASKTTFQEFLVPAQLARKWIIVGDVRQLPPFSEPKDLEASIEEVSDETNACLPDAYQTALLILFRLQRPEAGAGRVSWLIEEREDVLIALDAELRARAARGDQTPHTIRIGSEYPSDGQSVSLDELEAGSSHALRILTADWILSPPELRHRIERFLPANMLPLREWEPATSYAYKYARWHRQKGRFTNPINDQRRKLETCDALIDKQRHFFRNESWAKQVSWRLGRAHQLFNARNDKQREQRNTEVKMLLPAAKPFSTWVPTAVDAIRDVGVRSVIEALRVPRGDHKVRRLSALTQAIPNPVWVERSELLEYQHRMHPDISKYPRDQFYNGEALQDANTLFGRDEQVGWAFAPTVPARRIWANVRGSEDRGVNAAEVEELSRWLVKWKEYATVNRRKDGKDWEVACLAFYNRQEIAIRDMLRQITGIPRGETRFRLPNTSIVCATVDRFQGREADLVLLSLRNTSRPGHMDSPNRLNVAVTRARFLLVIAGHYKYYTDDCPSEELSKLALDTPVFDLRSMK